MVLNIKIVVLTKNTLCLTNETPFIRFMKSLHLNKSDIIVHKHKGV